MAKAKKVIKRYRSKGRWSSNIKTLTDQTISATGNSTFYGVTDLCTNPVQIDSTVSQQYTVKNIELSFEIDAGGQETGHSIEGLTTYIMYVPQGMTVTETYPNTHPEYIMAYRFRGSADIEYYNAQLQTPGRLPSKIKTRMARRLQTGDKVILLIVGSNSSSANINLLFNGLVRWWTKAN